jgi:hypothetical protein
MKKFTPRLLLAASFVIVFGHSIARPNLSDEQIKSVIIQQSVASYPGNCPCPYSVARNGSSCGARSAYSKPGGYDPICYPRDVTLSMVQDYRRRNGL